MVTVERVFPHVWPRLASEDALMRVVPVWDAVQRRPAGNTHVQQHVLLSWRTWNRGLRYVLPFCLAPFFFFFPLPPTALLFLLQNLALNNRTLTACHSCFADVFFKRVKRKMNVGWTHRSKHVTGPTLKYNHLLLLPLSLSPANLSVRPVYQRRRCERKLSTWDFVI